MRVHGVAQFLEVRDETRRSPGQRIAFPVPIVRRHLADGLAQPLECTIDRLLLRRACEYDAGA